jgi:hypothetical protein
MIVVVGEGAGLPRFQDSRVTGEVEGEARDDGLSPRLAIDMGLWVAASAVKGFAKILALMV